MGGKATPEFCRWKARFFTLAPRRRKTSGSTRRHGLNERPLAAKRWHSTCMVPVPSDLSLLRANSVRTAHTTGRALVGGDFAPPGRFRPGQVQIRLPPAFFRLPNA